jgi:C1A family cysteine protease
VVKNSWGTSWGASGYFYTPIGQNNFCMEQNAYAVVPTNWTGAGLYSNIGSHTRG